MSKDTYSELLKDPRWQKKRLEIFNRDGFACQSCGSKTRTLHVHHIKYLPMVTEPWEYPNWLLVTYCEICHNSEHLIGEVTRETFYEILDANTIYFRPLAQLCILMEKYKPLYPQLKHFLDEMMVEYLRELEALSLAERNKTNTDGKV